MWRVEEGGVALGELGLNTCPSPGRAALRARCHVPTSEPRNRSGRDGFSIFTCGFRTHTPLDSRSYPLTTVWVQAARGSF